MSNFTYKAFDFTIDSALELPGFPSTTGESDVLITEGTVPHQLKRPSACGLFFQAQSTEWLLTLERIAGVRFHIRDGREIVVERMPGSDSDTVRVFLLASAFPVLLFQRGMLPLHANAIATERGAVVIVGATGAGKSSLTAALSRHGYDVLTDDICAITIDSTPVPLVHPGIPRLKLWADTLAWFQEDRTHLRPIRPEMEKYQVPLDEKFCDAALPLHSIYLLKTGVVESVTVEAISGLDKVKLLQNHIYGAHNIGAYGLRTAMFRYLTRIAQHAAMHTVTRPLHRNTLEEIVQLIDADLK